MASRATPRAKTRGPASPDEVEGENLEVSTKPVADKLGIRPGDRLVVVGLPKDIAQVALEGTDHAVVLSLPRKLGPKYVGLAFVSHREAVARLAERLATRLEGDVRLWIAYPKGTNEINRDRGWEPIIALGLKTVAQVSLSDHWSALRFRRVEFVGR
jgi:hypothetical protein